MKKSAIGLVLIMFLSLLSFKTGSEGFQWLQWNDGYKKAKETNKIALIDTYTEWCGWCKKMDRDTYANDSIISRINANFVPIKFNPELPGKYQVNDTLSLSGPELLRALNQGKNSGYPTTFFYLPKKNKMFQYPGYMDAQQFGNLLDKLVEYHDGNEAAN